MDENQEKNTQEDYQKWLDEIDTLPFIERAAKVKEKILESDELGEPDKKFFVDCFDYVKSLYQKNKELDTNLLKIHMGIKGYDER